MPVWAKRSITAASLALWLAALGSWALSYRTGHIVSLWMSNGVTFQVWSGKGQLRVQRTIVRWPTGATHAGIVTQAPGRLIYPRTAWTRAGFNWSYYPDQGTWSLTVPHWLVVAVAALMPTYHLWSTLARRLRSWRGLCPRCGYDLRGGHGSGRCPECGTPAPAPPDGATATEQGKSSSPVNDARPL